MDGWSSLVIVGMMLGFCSLAARSHKLTNFDSILEAAWPIMYPNWRSVIAELERGQLAQFEELSRRNPSKDVAEAQTFPRKSSGLHGLYIAHESHESWGLKVFSHLLFGIMSMQLPRQVVGIFNTDTDILHPLVLFTGHNGLVYRASYVTGEDEPRAVIRDLA